MSETALATIVRSLVSGDSWAHRGRPVLRPSDTVALVFGIASPSPGDSFNFAERIGAMRLMAGQRSEETAWTSALPAEHSFASYLEAIVASLMLLSDSERAALSIDMQNAAWSLDLCPAPLWGHIRWVEMPAEGSPFPRKSMWVPSEEVSVFWSPPPPGVVRITCISFPVLVAAAEACLEAQRRADAKLSTPKPPRGSGTRRVATPKLRAASSDATSRNDTAASRPCQGTSAAVGSYQTGETRV